MTEPHLEHSIFGGSTRTPRRPHGGASRGRAARHRRAARAQAAPAPAGRRRAASSSSPWRSSRWRRSRHTRSCDPWSTGSSRATTTPAPAAGQVAGRRQRRGLGRAPSAPSLEKADVVKTRKAYLDAAAGDSRAQPRSSRARYTLKKQMTAKDALADPARPGQPQRAARDHP